MRQWKGEEIAALLDESGEPACPDCGTAMEVRAKIFLVAGGRFVAAIKASCPGCGEIIKLDTQLQRAEEWQRGRLCAG